MTNQDKFRILLCSDLDYEEMVADICLGSHTVAMITQENGVNNMEIEIFPSEVDGKSWKFPLNDFVDSIAFAKKCLTEGQKLPEHAVRRHDE